MVSAQEFTPEEALKVRAFGFDLPIAVDQTSWPDSEEEAIADAMILHALRVAAIADAEGERWMRWADLAGRGTDELRRRNDRWIDHVQSLIANSQVAALLVEVQKHDPKRADELARLIWDLTEDGGVFLELGWDWANARGVDAEQLYAWASKVGGAAFAHAADVDDETAALLGEPGGASKLAEASGE